MDDEEVEDIFKMSDGEEAELPPEGLGDDFEFEDPDDKYH